MVAQSVPDFFQEEGEPALRARVRWLEEHLGLDQRFFSRFLRADEGTLERWQAEDASLPSARQHALQGLWEMLMHVLSFVNFDVTRARTLLAHVAPADSRGPAWAGSSIKAYLETHNAQAADEVSRWITGFRFGPPSLSHEQDLPCPSTQD